MCLSHMDVCLSVCLSLPASFSLLKKKISPPNGVLTKILENFISVILLCKFYDLFLEYLQIIEKV